MSTVIFFLLLLASAFFSSAETAFLSLDKIRLKRIESMVRPSALRVVKLLSDPHKLLITILVGNTLVNIAASAVLADYFYNAMGEKGVIFSIVSMTVVVLIFGEVTPKMFALANNEKVSFFSSFPLKLLEVIFAPIRIVLTAISHAIVKGIGVKISTEHPKLTEQEIRSFFSLSRKKGVVKRKEKDMIDSILEFKELNAADIMTPRINIIALDLTQKINELIDRIKGSQFSRFPVYLHTLDNIVGIIHSKDFLLNQKKAIGDFVRKPFFAPESMKIDDLLKGLQRKHTHMAIVTDEYGVTSGVVTIEDILEEIVGEIRDELDFEVPMVRKLDQKTYEVNGQAHIDEIMDETGLSIETEEVDTIGGYFMLKIGKIPRAGDKINLGDFVLIVNDVSKNRITSLTITKKTKIA
ncbi:MAG: hemolysin family protein [Candidatus Omnitrophota bacterium]